MQRTAEAQASADQKRTTEILSPANKELPVQHTPNQQQASQNNLSQPQNNSQRGGTQGKQSQDSASRLHLTPRANEMAFDSQHRISDTSQAKR